MNTNINKKSISPLIATVLLILISVVLISSILYFSKDFTNKNLDNSSLVVYSDDDFKGFIKIKSVYEDCLGNPSKIIIENSNFKKDLNIISYKLIDPDALNTNYVDREYILDDPLIIEKGNKTNQLEIKCIPSNEFIIEIKTNNETYIQIPVSYLSASLTSCDNLPYCGDGICNNDENSDSCLEDCALSYFSTTWNTLNTSTSSSESNQISLPLVSDGNYDFTVNWGDGSTSEITSYDDSDKIHTYSSSGIYDVNISGEIEGWSFNNSGDKLKLIGISNWGPLKLGYCNSHFCGCSNLIITAEDILDLSGVKSLSYTFANCSSIVTIPNLEYWDLTKINYYEGLYGMFYGASNFNQDISNWDLSTITNIMFLFYSASDFNQPLNDWNTSNVTNMYRAFSGATSFNQPLNNWDTSNVTNMQGLFLNASDFNQPLNDWNVSKVSSFNTTFKSATSFNQPLNNWDTSNVSSFEQMFYEATSFNQDISSWDVSKSNNNFRSLFYNASSFDQNLASWIVGYDDEDNFYVDNIFSNSNISLENCNSILHSWDFCPEGCDECSICGNGILESGENCECGVLWGGVFFESSPFGTFCEEDCGSAMCTCDNCRYIEVMK